MNPAVVRPATAADAPAIGRLLDAFNHEFDEPTPGPGWLAERIAALLAQDTVVLLAGASEPDGLAVLRFDPRSGPTRSSATSPSFTSSRRGVGTASAER